MRVWITRRLTLWLAFVLTVLLTFAFQPVAATWNLVLLDSISDPEAAREIIRLMSDRQREAHALITATLDVAYPFAYGTLFAGSVLALFDRGVYLLAIPALAVVPVDLIEGVVQILALTGTADWLDAKAVLTPLKFLLFFVALGATIVGWGRWTINYWRRRKNDDGTSVRG